MKCPDVITINLNAQLILCFSVRLQIFAMDNGLRVVRGRRSTAEVEQDERRPTLEDDSAHHHAVNFLHQPAHINVSINDLLDLSNYVPINY